ncbi:lipase family protein [Microbulbifer marinus]|uniref:Lipase (Class 3) n=1 Tax=Microbulbifer marinus TaxID=658218 RepID=A0A1H4BFG1_9GAMM|nr:lipase family protein [Microbulbifer marinus]SEA46728.1 Lipase (class 3) [Microbulbifer marinus]
MDAARKAEIAASTNFKEEEVQTIDFSQVNWYAMRAAAAYQAEAGIRQTFPATTLVTTTSNDVQFFLECDTANRRQIISIRGTANLGNAREDADYVQSRNTRLGIYLHSGFDEDAMQVFDALLPSLDKSQQIILTGHSLGAAISTILMMYLHEEGFELGPSINFGQPKVTNGRGVKKYSALPLLRVVDENDLVPLVPPNDLIDEIHGGYQHLGPELMLLEGEYYVYQDAHTAQHSAISAFWRNLGHMSISAHYMQHYLHNINSKLAQAVQVSYGERAEHIDC